MKGTITPMPNQATHPKTFAGLLVEYGDEIENIACVITWKKTDERKETITSVHHTSMPLAEAVWLQWVFSMDFPPQEMLEGHDGRP